MSEAGGEEKGRGRQELARALEAGLRGAGVGDLRFDALARVLYSSDASIYQVEPLGVACPRDADEVAAAVSVCAELGVPITARAGGTGLAGQALGEGLILDTSRHLRQLAIDAEARRVVAQPGVVLDRLNREAGRHGLGFEPAPASSDRACLGGIVANNSTGARSVVHGMTADHLRAAEVVLADGATARFDERGPRELARTLAPDTCEAAAYEAVAKILREGVPAIERDFPRYWRRAGGYNLDRVVRRGLGSDALSWSVGGPRAGHVTDASPRPSTRDWERPEVIPGEGARIAETFPGPIHLGDLLAGSEGSLAIATSLELDLQALPAARGLLVLQTASLAEAFEAVPGLLESGPSAIELVDRSLLRLARDAPGHAADLAFVQGDPAALLIVEQEGGSERRVEQALLAARRAWHRAGFRGTTHLALRSEEQDRVWRARKAGLGILARRRGDRKPVAGIEDTAVPPEQLARYMAEVEALLAEMDVEASFYAHASAGCIHVRPVLDLKSARDVARLDQLCEAVFELARKHGGVHSSEHGDGIARSGYNARLFGPAVFGMFEAVKQAFDPQGILNPGKVIGPLPRAEQLRYGPGYRASSPAPRLAHAKDGDLTRAVEQCSGIGVCRKEDGGAMCPSYRLTLEERDSTRGRANALRAALDGRLPEGRLASDAVREVMDLCVGCKACKTECPAGVDMARLKIETSAARGAAHGFPLRSQLFGRVHALDRLLSRTPRLANRLLRGPVAARLSPLVGLHPDRRFPPLARQSLDRWWREQGLATCDRQRIASAGRGRDRRSRVGARPDEHFRSNRQAAPAGRQLVLFADTFTTFHEPGIGQAVARLAEAAGYEALLPLRRRCCGRPALSQGLVPLARRELRANLARLAPAARAGVPILVPEPSCASVFRDELPDLLTRPGEVEDARALSRAVVTVEEWLASLPEGAIAFRAGPERVLLHLHCHQRALIGPGPSLAALARVPDLEVHEPDAGCCGMAGAFGYERDHHAASVGMARLRLVPAIERLDPEIPILAPGASCRHQIADLTGRRARHPAELLAELLR